jgi:hypothetical protein
MSISSLKTRAVARADPAPARRPSLNVKGLLPKANKEVRMSRHEGFSGRQHSAAQGGSLACDFEAELLF